MSPSEPQDPQEIFEQFLSRLCAEETVDIDYLVTRHPEHEGALRRLWKDHQKVELAFPTVAGSFFALPRQPREPPSEIGHVKRGDTIGDFRLFELIAKGGMGQVWLADQLSLKRQVALKLVLPEQLSEDALALFAREARAGGRLSHPGIVVVHGHGTSEGLAWIAMELVPGARTLRDFIREAKDSENLPEDYYRRVAVFVAAVADALEAAHEAGVIHRDVKPGNILITSNNEPKVTDFGLARITDEAVLSRTGGFAGTYAYMSPEQVTARRMGIDHRTDVFSLGVVFYEMLTLRRPFEGDTTHQLTTQIVTADPPDPQTVRSRVPRDMAVIAGKCLEKGPDRRYQTIAELAADIRRHLSHEPILAQSPGRLRKLKLWAQRNPTKSVAGAVAAIALVVITGLWWRAAEAEAETADALKDASLERDDAREARNAERRQKEEAERARVAEAELREEAEAARLAEAQLREEAERAQAAEERLRREADQARNAERDSRRRAERQADNARAATEFLVGILELANPEVSLQSELSMREVLDRATIEVERSLPNQPEAEGPVRTTLGRAYLSIGELEPAEKHLRRALEILDASGTSRPEEQYRVLWPLVRVMIGKASFTSEDLNMALRWQALVPQMFGDEYAELRDALPHQPMPEEPDVEGIARLARAELRPGNPLRLVVADYLWAIGWYASLLGAPDDYTQLALEESLRIRRSELPESHPDIAATLNALVDLLNRAGRFDRAEKLIQESIGIRRDVLPEDDVGIAATLSLLGECLAGQGRREEAEEHLLSSWQTIREARAPGHPEVVAALSRLVRVYEGWREEEEARTHRRALARALASSVWERIWPAPRLVFGPEHGALFEVLDRLQGQVERSRPRASMRPDEFRAAVEELQDTWRDLVGERERSLPADHPLALLCAQYLTEWGGNLHNSGGDVAVCEAIFRQSLTIQEEHAPQPLYRTRYATLWWLAYICELDGRFQEGELLARDALSAARELNRVDGWDSADAGCVLGACLVGQGCYAEAEPLVLGGALSMLDLRSIEDGNVRRACEGVRDLYALWGDPRNADAVWSGILRETVDRGLSGPFIDRTVQSVVATPGLEAGTYDLARDFVSGRLSGQRSDEARRRLLTQLLLTHLRAGAYEEARSVLPELDAGPGGASAVVWAAYAMALGELGETEEAAQALTLAKDILAEGGADAAAARWIAEAEAALR